MSGPWGWGDAWDTACDSVRHFFYRRSLSPGLRLLAARQPLFFFHQAVSACCPIFEAGGVALGGGLQKMARPALAGTTARDGGSQGGGKRRRFRPFPACDSRIGGENGLCLSTASAPCFQTPLSRDQTAREAVVASRCQRRCMVRVEPTEAVMMAASAVHWGRVSCSPRKRKPESAARAGSRLMRMLKVREGRFFRAMISTP